MSIHIGIGFSKNENPFRAAQDAVSQANLHLGPKKNFVNLVLIFSTTNYCRLETLQIIKEAFPSAKIVGCSSSGLILSKTIEMRGISILAISSPDLAVSSFCLENMHTKDVLSASQKLANQCLKNFGSNTRQLSLLLCDGLSKENPLLLDGLKEVLGQLSPLVGAGSSDYFQYEKTYQYFDDRVLNNSAVLTLLGGSIEFGISSQHGWKPLGKPRTIDEAKKNIIKKINGRKAFSLYEEFFESQAKELFSNRTNRLRVFYPLGISISDEKKYLLQNITEVLDDGSLVCQADVPEGSEVHIMIGNKDSCKEAAYQAACEAKESLLHKSPAVAIILESSHRQKLLGRHAFQEIKMVREALGENIPIFGMYSYGEFAPFSSGKQTGRAFLQNETIIVLVIGERSGYQTNSLPTSLNNDNL